MISTTSQFVQAEDRGMRASLTSLWSLSGRVALVTGSSRGIGLSIARRLAEAGADVVISAPDGSEATEAAERLSSSLGRALHAVTLDVGDPGCIQRAVDEATERCGRLDILVNNAGIFPGTPLASTAPADFARVLQVNLTGAFLTAQAALPHLRASKRGCIVNVASVGAFRGRPGFSAYSASKHGLVGLTRSLALELGPEGIRVCGVAPTLVRTPGIAEREASASAEDLHRIQSLVKRVIDGIPLGRPAEADEIACAVVFLSSDMARFVTGATLPVDGGNLAG